MSGQAKASAASTEVGMSSSSSTWMGVTSVTESSSSVSSAEDRDAVIELVTP